MDQQYPETLFSAVAQDILAKYNRVPSDAVIKEANDKTLEDYQKEYEKAFAEPAGGYKTVTHSRNIPDPDKYRGISSGLSGLAGLIGGALLGKKFGKEPTAPLEGGFVGGGLGAMGGFFIPSLLPDRLKTKVETDSYETPSYSPEQEEARHQIYDDKNNIIDQFGKRLLEQGHYEGPGFENLFEDPEYLENSHYQEMIKRYPRLLDAMKQDYREDRGGILWQYHQSLENLKDNPEAQTKLYDYLQKALDNQYFYGWKWPFETPQEVDETMQDLDQRLKQASAPIHGLAKLANEQMTPEKADAMNQFLSQYNFTPAQFSGDPAAYKAIEPQETAAIRELRKAFEAQAQMLGGSTPELKRNQELALQNIRNRANAARIDKSIESTMETASKDPEQFNQMADLSNRSQAALDKNKSDLIGTVGGGALGGLGGFLLGKSPVGRAVSGLSGVLGGSLAGRALGRHAEEYQTGYAHNDVLRPYQVADRLNRRQNADLKV